MMSSIKIEAIDLEGAFLVENFYSGDLRGGFMKFFEKEVFSGAGISFSLSETFVSRSEKNVIRGLHFQHPKPQAKIISVLSGLAWDVIVDLRPNSKTFKQWRGFELSEKNHMSIYIPRGFAHGFASLQNDTVMIYLCEGEYYKKFDTGIIFNDAEIGIDWPVAENIAIHSDRDLKLRTLREYLDSNGGVLF